MASGDAVAEQLNWRRLEMVVVVEIFLLMDQPLAMEDAGGR